MSVSWFQENCTSFNNSFYKTLFQTAGEGFWCIDKAGVTLDVNPAMCAIIGRACDDIIGRSVFDFFDTANAVIARQEFAARRQGQAGAFEVALSRPDGTIIPCLNNAVPVLDDHGQMIASIGLFTDLSEIRDASGAFERARDQLLRQQSERAQAEAALGKSEAKYRNLLDDSIQGVVVHQDGKIVYANAAASEIYGYPHGKLVGFSVQRIFPAHEQDRIDQFREQKISRLYRIPGCSPQW